MATYAATISTPRSPADAFHYLATFSNAADWDPGVLSAEQLDAGPVRPGTRFRLTVPFLGRRLRLVYRVTGLQPGRQVVLRAARRGAQQPPAARRIGNRSASGLAGLGSPVGRAGMTKRPNLGVACPIRSTVTRVW